MTKKELNVGQKIYYISDFEYALGGEIKEIKESTCVLIRFSFDTQLEVEVEVGFDRIFEDRSECKIEIISRKIERTKRNILYLQKRIETLEQEKENLKK